MVALRLARAIDNDKSDETARIAFSRATNQQDLNMRRPQTAMRDWLHTATPDQAREVAKIADTSVPHLRHIAAGRRQMSAELAQRLAHASRELHVLALRLDQRELCRACAACPLVTR